MLFLCGRTVAVFDLDQIAFDYSGRFRITRAQGHRTHELVMLMAMEAATMVRASLPSQPRTKAAAEFRQRPL